MYFNLIYCGAWHLKIPNENRSKIHKWDRERDREKDRENPSSQIFFSCKLPKAKCDGGRRKRGYRYTILWNKNRSVLSVGQEGGGFGEWLTLPRGYYHCVHTRRVYVCPHERLPPSAYPLDSGLCGLPVLFYFPHDETGPIRRADKCINVNLTRSDR